MFKIREALAADLPAITSIYAECVLNDTATYEIDAPDLGEMTKRFETIKANGYPYLVAEDEQGVVLGYAYASAFRGRPAYNWLVEDSIYLAPAARGKGLGKVLLKTLLERCSALGFRQMTAVIGGASAGSIAVHASLGFEHCGRLKASGFKHGKWLDTVFMQIAMGEGDKTLPDPNVYPGKLYQ
ncbi:GNAT family N-acetyltransferase [Rhizobium sp. L1K21]|uniref:GNAT family N-acetyltransferase n=1 Tax=Rhizobium sp. L1K21 TaxID=2954933 RepID=UPI0020934363|nr:GNAT family N-acetyltransferase [Rhizobium sp. L1K21]MCO6184748.1 GNAT family N-acetyltransferase [Rhizobium sp. L1K21]